MNVNEKLDEIEARIEAATGTKWEAAPDEVRGPSRAVVYPHDSDSAVAFAAADDAEFIAHARTDVPWLVEQVIMRDEALRAVLALLDDPSLGIAGTLCVSVEDVRDAITKAFEA